MTKPSGTASRETSSTTPNLEEKSLAATQMTETRLSTQEGKITVAEGVVQKIAGMATREIAGVYSMGTSTTRAFGAIRQRIPGSSGPNVAQGVGVEVGETQAAIDLDIVIEYGASIADLGRSIQRNVKQSIERMTGLEVVEVNVAVDDVHLPTPEGEEKPPPRVS
ncbi:MAG TPA: Asp23/Gls24 family envelope stress response protein [Thermomicrobiales bacterium]|jgi:uncharacterized alkaline shock family protein YloU|nr:Asp23/Gls24 family envelope stress response protein [Thermomicrobiales bacterium]